MQRPVGGMFLRHRIAEIGEHFAHPALSHHSTMAGDHSGRVVAPGIDDEAQLLRIVRQLCPLRRQYLGRQCSHVAPFRIARAYLGWVRLRHCGSLDLPRRRGKLVAAVRHSDYQGRALGIRLDLAAQADDLHVDAAVVGLGVTPRQKLQQLVAGQHPSGPPHEHAEQAELTVRERNLPTCPVRQAVAGEIQAILAELEHCCRVLRHGFGCQRLGHPHQDCQFVRGFGGVSAPFMCPDQQDVADGGPQLLDQASSGVTETLGSDNRQCNPVEANANGVGSTFRDLDAITATAQQACKTSALRHIATDDHDPAAHPNYPQTRRT